MMSLLSLSPQQMRWCGWTLFAGSLLSILVYLLSITISIPLILIASVGLLSGLLVLVGLPGPYYKQHDQVGILGTVGFVVLWLTSLVVTVVVNVEEIVIAMTVAHPTAQSVPPILVYILNLSDFLLLIGALLYGAQTLRAHIFPASTGWLLIASVVVLALTLFIGGAIAPLLYVIGVVLLQSGFARFGYALARWPEDGELEAVGTEKITTTSDLT